MDLGFKASEAVTSALSSKVLTTIAAKVTVSAKASPNGSALERPYDKVTFVTDSGNPLTAETPDEENLSQEAFVQGCIALYGSYKAAARDLIYAHDLGVKSNIRQSLMTGAEGPDKAILAAAKKLVGVIPGKSLDDIVAMLKAQSEGDGSDSE